MSLSHSETSPDPDTASVCRQLKPLNFEEENYCWMNGNEMQDFLDFFCGSWRVKTVERTNLGFSAEGGGE